MTQKRLQCFYCDALISKGDYESDHFPIPYELGGERTVPACKTCHDMKDRFCIGDWPGPWLAHIIADFPKLSRETRIFLAKAMAAGLRTRDDILKA